MKVKKCKLISFHYKEEAIIIERDCDKIIHELNKYYNLYLKEHKKHYQDYITQLDLMKKNWHVVMMDNELKNHFITNIYVLTMMKKLINDEYNGLHFIYEMSV